MASIINKFKSLKDPSQDKIVPYTCKKLSKNEKANNNLLFFILSNCFFTS